MAFDYAQAQIDADGLIREFGMQGAIRRSTPGTNRLEPAPVPVDYPCWIVMPFHSKRKKNDSDAQEEELEALVSPIGLKLPLPFEQGDMLVKGKGTAAKTYTMLDLQPFDPGDVEVYYVARVQR
jgi:hypothetical protein